MFGMYYTSHAASPLPDPKMLRGKIVMQKSALTLVPYIAWREGGEFGNDRFSIISSPSYKIVLALQDPNISDFLSWSATPNWASFAMP